MDYFLLPRLLISISGSLSFSLPYREAYFPWRYLRLSLSYDRTITLLLRFLLLRPKRYPFVLPSVNRYIFSLFFALTGCLSVSGQVVSVKTNLLYGGLTGTPNLGAEFGLSPRLTLDVSGGYNPFGLSGSKADNKKLVHWIVQPELRYWTCRRFGGHFFGVHALYSDYNISGKKLPLLFGSGSQAYRFQGTAVGSGLSYGYQWVIGKHWNIEFTLGAGAVYMKHDKYDCARCGDKIRSGQRRMYYGPTKAGITLVYVIK